MDLPSKMAWWYTDNCIQIPRSIVWMMDTHRNRITPPSRSAWSHVEATYPDSMPMVDSPFWWFLETKKIPRVYRMGAILEFCELLGFDITQHVLSEKTLTSTYAIFDQWDWSIAREEHND